MLAVVTGDGSMGGLGFKRLAIRGDEHGGHEAERPEPLGDNVGLNVSIVVFHSNDEAPLALDHLRDHVVDQTVLVPDAGGVKVLFVLRLVDFLEHVLELAIVCLQNGVFGAHVQRQLLVEGHLEGGVGKARDGFGGVVLGLGDTTLGGEVVDLDHLWLPALGGEDHFEGTLTRNNAVLGAILVAKGMPADDDGLFPAGYQARNAGNDNGLAENGSASVVLSSVTGFFHAGACDVQMIPDGTVGRQPHLLELELLDSLLIGCDGGALDTHRVLLDRLGSIQRHLVVGLVTVFQAEVVVLEVDVEIGMDELEGGISGCRIHGGHVGEGTLSLMTCQMILVISSPSSSTTGFTTLIFLIPVEEAILRCVGWVQKLVAGEVVWVARRGLAYWADVAADWEARQRVAKLHVCRRASLGREEVAERMAAGRRVDSMVAITSVWRLGRELRLPAAIPIAQRRRELAAWTAVASGAAKAEAAWGALEGREERQAGAVTRAASSSSRWVGGKGFYPAPRRCTDNLLPWHERRRVGTWMLCR